MCEFVSVFKKLPLCFTNIFSTKKKKKILPLSLLGRKNFSSAPFRFRLRGLQISQKID